MLLKRLVLKNIRSYKELDIEFNEGITLLAGDIGSGKTTILLSIEFALLGLHSDITGSTLLRHGETSGEVRLELEINGKVVTIARNLKRASGTVKQEAGYIETNNEKLDLTARELKSKVIELLGYPKELADKNKDVIYRYTVYTPQEEMKSILYEKPEERIEKIRKIFNIDKYKLIKENSSILIREIRSDNRYLLSRIEEEKPIREEIEDLSLEVVKLEKALTELKVEIENQQKLTSKKQDELILEEEKQLALQKKVSEKQVLDSEIKSVQKQKLIYQNSINQLELEIKRVIEKPKEVERIDYEESLKEINEKIETVLDKKQKAKEKLAVLESDNNKSKTLIKNISSITTCSVCLQPMNESHKKHIEEKENQTIKTNETRVVELKEYVKKAEIIESKFKLEKESLIKKQMSQRELVLLNKRYEELLVQKENKSKELKQFEEKIKELNVKEEELKVKFNSIIIKETSEEFNLLKAEVEKHKTSLNNLDKEKLSLELKIKYTNKGLEEKNLKLEGIKLIKDKIERNNILENWLEKGFVNLMDTIEKHVLSNVYNEFNERFKTWFEILLEQETMMSELDEDFAPKINQNGFDTDISNLSGGEKTATALAYRLALNKTINDYVSTINTRNIIILDEPTDGFSSDQLDKLRDVLEQLNNKQTIIVSHEPKLESMAEHIIRIRKHEHESTLI
jgi:DNA repair protein SbcC/Rad50